ncbi:hypothetical protein AVEN_174767-1 [Araneus ventricosus]|uniref:DUF4817 domain-containing protein n=1 Tax=Araneus ventricosus TaxID=182803 RepID=A0A4Y2BLL1_ARAVE|nr:hypothetical protein AVEN_174767-1 [Araneus ventricosus]
MSGPRLTFEKGKFILKCYWNYANVAEVRRQYCRKFQADPPTRLTVNRIKDKFETNGTVQNVHRQSSGSSRTSTSFTSRESVLENYRQTSKKYVRQTSREIGIRKSSAYCIFKRCVNGNLHSNDGTCYQLK